LGIHFCALLFAAVDIFYNATATAKSFQGLGLVLVFVWSNRVD